MKLLEKRQKIADILFFIALTAELFFMVVEKSELPIDYISYVFRVTFLIALLSLIITRHSIKEWGVILIILIFTFYCYRVTGRNELLRFSVFMLAAKNINLEKTMKYWFYFSAAGYLLIFLLSLPGILGSLYLETDFGRGSIERRYVFGFGHPNTICGCFLSLLLLWIWIYGKKAKLYSYAIMLLAAIGIYYLTVSRTFLAITLITLFYALVIRLLPKLENCILVYALSAVISPLVCVYFSSWAAKYSIYYWDLPNMHNPLVRRIDGYLNGRIANLYYSWENHGATYDRWTLFSASDCEEFFDMGWVRLYYWYGIIPASIIIALIVLLIYICWKKKDLWTVVLIFSLCIYTVIEATFVSRYIGRNFMLPIMAVYMYDFFKKPDAL